MAVTQQEAGARKRPCFVFGLLLCVLFAPQAFASRGRIAPPAQAACPGGNLTAFTGKTADVGTYEIRWQSLEAKPSVKGAPFVLRGRCFHRVCNSNLAASLRLADC